jgi:hypothetical protein
VVLLLPTASRAEQGPSFPAPHSAASGVSGPFIILDGPLAGIEVDAMDGAVDEPGLHAHGTIDSPGDGCSSSTYSFDGRIGQTRPSPGDCWQAIPESGASKVLVWVSNAIRQETRASRGISPDVTLDLSKAFLAKGINALYDAYSAGMISAVDAADESKTLNDAMKLDDKALHAKSDAAKKADIDLALSLKRRFVRDLPASLTAPVGSTGPTGATGFTGPPPTSTPSASFSFTPNNPPTAPKVGATVDFTSTSTDSGGTITTYNWTFAGPLDGGGGSPGTVSGGSGPTPSLSFSAAGLYPVTLKITDNLGATSSSAQDVKVSGPGTAASAVGTTSCPPMSGTAQATIVIYVPSFAQNVALEASTVPATICPDTSQEAPMTSLTIGNTVGATDAWGQPDNTFTVTIDMGWLSGSGGGSATVPSVSASYQ